MPQQEVSQVDPRAILTDIRPIEWQRSHVQELSRVNHRSPSGARTVYFSFHGYDNVTINTYLQIVNALISVETLPQ